MELASWTLVALSLLILVGPGYVVARGLRLPPAVAIGAAPLVAVGVVTALSLVLPANLGSGQPWSVTLFVTLLVLTIGGAFFWWKHRETVEREHSWVLTVAVIGSTMIALLITGWQIRNGMGDLSVPLQRRDALFHYNAIAGILNGWGTVDPLHSTGWMFGREGSAGYYPSAYYGLAAVLPGSSGVLAGNATAIAAVFVWIIGMVSLARVVLPKLPGAWIATPLLTVVAISFPLVPFFRHGQWPFALSLALLPGLIAVSLHVLPTKSRLGLVGIAFGFVAIAGAHPSGLVLPGILALVVVALQVLTALVAIARKQKSVQEIAVPLALSASFLAVAAGVILVASGNERLLAMGAYPRDQTPAIVLLKSLLGWGHVDPFEPYPVFNSTLLFAITILGFIVLAYFTLSRYLLITGLILTGILVLTSSTSSLSDFLGAVWYGDPERITATIAPIIILAGAAAIGAAGAVLARYISAREDLLTAATAAVLVALVVVPVWVHRTDVRTNIVLAENYYPNTANKYMVGGPVWTEADVDIWNEWARIVGDDTVFGDPATGSVFLPALKNIRTVPATSSMEDLPPEGLEAARGIRGEADLSEGSPGCQFIIENNIHWVVVEPSMGTRFRNRFFTAAFVDRTSEIVALEGEQGLWRIEACW